MINFYFSDSQVLEKIRRLKERQNHYRKRKKKESKKRKGVNPNNCNIELGEKIKKKHLR